MKQELRAGIVALPFVLAAGGNGFAQTTERISVASDETQANSGSGTTLSIAADGRCVAFESAATNLVSGDTNAVGDVFVRDRQLGTTERVSVVSGGGQANGRGRSPSISAHGQYVAFHSVATNLVTGDTNGFGDIFVRDRVLNVTERVSVSSSGTQSNNNSDAVTSISADGRFVAFASASTNLTTGDVNAKADVFVRDRLNGTTRLASVSGASLQGNADSAFAAISADGRYVLFNSYASNFPPGASAGTYATYLRDMDLSTLECVSANLSGGVAVGSNTNTSGVISADGRFVVFSSTASNLVASDTNANFDVFLRDRETDTTEIVSLSTGGAQSNATLETAMLSCISADGRFVAFVSRGTNLVVGDMNGYIDVFVRDRVLRTTERVSLTTDGYQANGLSGFGLLACSISADGRHVAFLSGATNLVAGDSNGVDDVLVRDRGPIPPFVTTCVGDGSGVACPCANYGSLGHGCNNSLLSGGARLSASGTASVSADSLLLSGSGMPDVGSVLYFQGSTSWGGPLGAVFGDGIRCVGGSVIRLGATFNVGGSSMLGAPAGDAPISQSGVIPSTGGSFHYQAWYRNAASYCTSSVFNLSNGVLVIWGA